MTTKQIVVEEAVEEVTKQDPVRKLLTDFVKGIYNKSEDLKITWYKGTVSIKIKTYLNGEPTTPDPYYEMTEEDVFS